MNACLLTGTTESWFPLRDQTYPFLRAYADRVGARFRSFLYEEASPSLIWWQKFDIIASALREYDRVVYIDADVLVLEGASDMFSAGMSREVVAYVEYRALRRHLTFFCSVKRLVRDYPEYFYSSYDPSAMLYICAGLVSYPACFSVHMKRPKDLSHMPILGEQHFTNALLDCFGYPIVPLADACFYHGTYAYDRRMRFVHFVGGGLDSKLERLRIFRRKYDIR